MNNILIRTPLFLFLFLFTSYQPAYSLEVETHKLINEMIANGTMNNFSLDSYLRNSIGLPKGITEVFNQKQVVDWLKVGGQYEDEPPATIPYLRSVNHFHNPLTKQGFGGIWDTGFLSGVSSIQWSQAPMNTQSPGGYYSWNDARAYFYNALIFTDKTTRDQNFADTFRGVGQLMHLVEDLSVPEHTRNEGHGLLYNYEYWAKININKSSLPNYPPIYFDSLAIGNTNPFAAVPVANLFDTNQ